MPYISNGQVVSEPRGFVAVAKKWLAALLAFIMFFFQAMTNPAAVDEAKKKAAGQRASQGRPGPGGPRIRGMDRITGKDHQAQCAGGG